MQTAWSPNGQAISQVETLTISAVANGGTLTAQINQKSITYTCTATDTTATATTNWLALLTATQASGPAEFAEITFAAGTAANQITCTSGTQGQPFSLTSSAAGGATVVQTHTTASSSPSDVSNPNNWLRGGFPGLPQTGDDLVIAASAVPLLWNLGALAAVFPNSVTRWQSFTGTIGLPLVNANGYIEYRPTDLQFGSSAGSSSSSGPGAGLCTVNLGVSDPSTGGTGPTRERYNFGSQQCAWNIFAAGTPQDDYAIHLLGTNALNALNVVGTSVGVAMKTGQLSSILSASVDGGGSLSLSAGVSFLGTLTLNNGSGGIFNCSPQLLQLLNGSTCTVGGLNLVYPSVQASQGSNVAWLSNSNITNLILQTGSIFDKSGDFRKIVIGNLTIDGDTCLFNDPLNACSFSNPATVKNAVTSGPFIFTGPRTVLLV